MAGGRAPSRREAVSIGGNPVKIEPAAGTALTELRLTTEIHVGKVGLIEF